MPMNAAAANTASTSLPSGESRLCGRSSGSGSSNMTRNPSHGMQYNAPELEKFQGGELNSSS